ncbi:hypothetical protein H7E67_03765 [Clostridium gasigenes]|uniref:hypothetical protein n=1 Tax=Clostridium gasigenes TaxID=94869 RepID=UPI001626713A|nr:hypothetical protein [Clostridium gasigenes]MBB6622539.1 hypothetical protein [Clostridium gasigenes]
MIFNDVVDWYSDIKEATLFLGDIKKEFSEIRKSYYTLTSSTLEATLTNMLSANNINSITGNISIKFNSIAVVARRVKLINIGRNLYKLEVLATSYPNINNPITDLIESLEYCSDKIHNYYNNPTIPLDDLSTLIASINVSISDIERVEFLIEYLSKINNVIQSEHDYSIDSVLSIRLYRENMTVSELTFYMNLINKLYERSCTLFNISTTDYPLIPIKIESGSLLEKVIGHEKVMAFLGDFLNRGIGFIHRNYTDEGKLGEHKNKINAVKDNLDIVKLCEEHGIDTSKCKKIIQENVDALCLDLYKLTTSSGKISVNNTTHNISEEVNKQLSKGQLFGKLTTSGNNPDDTPTI